MWGRFELGVLRWLERVLVASFDTTHSIPQILQFYRDSYAKMGLREDSKLTQIDPKSAAWS